MSAATKTVLKHINGLGFEVELANHRFVIDSPNPKFGGQDRGPSPKSLLLPALGGCTGMDVVSILNKMKVPYTSFEVEVDGELNDEHPIVFTKLTVRYIIRGKNVPEDKVKRAVELSQKTYCGVAAMLGKAAELKHEIVIEDE